LNGGHKDEQVLLFLKHEEYFANPANLFNPLLIIYAKAVSLEHFIFYSE